MSADLPIDVQPVLDLRFYERSLRDRSGFGNHAAVVEPGAWVRSGPRDALIAPGSIPNSHLLLTASPLPSGSDYTLFIYGAFRRQLDNLFMVLSSGNSPWFYLLGTALVLRQNGVYSLRVANAVGAGALAVTATATSAAPLFYRDADFLGPGSLAVDGGAAAGSWKLMGSQFTGMLDSPIAGYLAVPAALPADRIAALYAWSREQITPELRTPGRGYQYPGGIQSGDLVWRAAIQTARVSLRDWGAGEELGKSGLTIASGTWRITEDATGRAAECIADGQVFARLLGADARITRVLETEGSVTLTKTTTQVQLDATAGAKIRAVELEQP